MTLKQAINGWDKNSTFKSVNMGGLGDGYDTAITALCIELCRFALDNGYTEGSGEMGDEPRKAFSDLLNTQTDVIDQLKWGGFSGAQVSMAKQVAYQFVAFGYDYMMNKAKEQCPDRIKTFERKGIFA